MQQNKTNRIHIATIGVLMALICTSFGLSSCKKKVGPTAILIQDSIRHYYTVLQGQELEMTFKVANIGETPLVITDIQPSCGCISSDKEEQNLILPGKEGRFKFVFHSEKYLGYVHHTIRLFGNMQPNGMAEMTFDTHIVPPYNASPDYEDVYREYVDKHNRFDDLTKAKDNQRGYWTDFEEYSTDHKRYLWHDDTEANQANH